MFNILGQFSRYFHELNCYFKFLLNMNPWCEQATQNNSKHFLKAAILIFFFFLLLFLPICTHRPRLWYTRTNIKMWKWLVLIKKMDFNLQWSLLRHLETIFLLLLHWHSCLCISAFVLSIVCFVQWLCFVVLWILIEMMFLPLSFVVTC